MQDIEIELYDQLSDYASAHSLPEHDILRQLREKTIQEVTFSHMLSASVSMRFVQLLLQLMQARRVIEIGVYTGYSALAMAQVLPADGQIIAIDHSKPWTDVAKPFWQAAGVDHKIDLRLGDALDVLGGLSQEPGVTPFDFIFVDADKIQYKDYLEFGFRFLRSNGLMVFDNTLFISDGSVLDLDNPTMRAVDAFNKALYQDARFDVSLLTVFKGLTLVRKR
ncbi:MAG: class I SAM-dependent methyltransferase [Gammaproteobacteria bacterium]|nr:class I SAM-dependent methyltransferase [Gammaproteobacteria bacterium]MCH9743852.1 class I SAM-dependent methyltransferase [Gammaproteobacteria bacterium]